jgi:hypothetical protein
MPEVYESGRKWLRERNDIIYDCQYKCLLTEHACQVRQTVLRDKKKGRGTPSYNRLNLCRESRCPHFLTEKEVRHQETILAAKKSLARMRARNFGQQVIETVEDPNQSPALRKKRW